MTARRLAALALLALVAALAALYTGTMREPQGAGAASGAPLIAGLKDAINDVSEIRLATAGDATAVTLVRGETQWSVKEKDGYVADTGSIRELLLGLADARRREAKTANPDNYAFLEVSAIDSADAKGVQVALSGIDAAPVIVGKAASGAGEATYARLANEDQSWLVNGRIDVARTPLDWLNRDIVDLPSSRIQAVSVQHPDGETLRISRPSRAESTFTVEGVPDGRELTSASVAAPMASVLQSLRLDDVMPAAGSPLAAPTVVEYRTFDGLVLRVEAQGQADEALVHFGVSFDSEQARAFMPPAEDFETVAGDEAPADSTGDEQSASAEEAGLDDVQFTAAEEEAAELDARLSPWVYRIPTYKREQLTKRMDDLLKALPEPAAE
ncbi:MAG: DUF4340 domain-containing protein [Pseudomonadota bacterium]